MKYLSITIIYFYLTSCSGKLSEQKVPEGSVLPSFNLLLPDSSSYTNTERIAFGKPSVLFFFGPHCPYSKAQVKEITKHINELKNIQFYLFTSYPFISMQQFYTDFGLKAFPNITTGFDYNNFFAPYFDVKAVPYIAVYGRDKKLKQIFTGLVSFDKIIETTATNTNSK
jgi:thiol-disulfide isomerase/thioredoxin